MLFVVRTIIKFIVIKSIPLVVNSGNTQVEFIFNEGCAEADRIFLLIEVAGVYLYKAIQRIGGLPGDDINYTTHSVS